MIALARDRTIASYHYLCRRGARKFLRPGLERCDLEQVAAIGLIKAFDRYDISLRTPFEAYAWLMIVGELMHHIRDYQRIVRVPRWMRSLEGRYTRAQERLTARLEREPTDVEVAAEIGVPTSLVYELQRARDLGRQASLDVAAPAGDGGRGRVVTGRQPSATTEDRIVIGRALSALSPAERTIVLGVYGLGMTQAEVSRQAGLAPRHVSRLHRRALRAIRTSVTGLPTDGALARQTPLRATSMRSPSR